MRDSYATGSVSGNTVIGGFTGFNSNSDIFNSYSTVNVTGTTNQVAGVSGRGGGEINSFSTGNVIASGAATNVGPFKGTGTDSNNYYYTGALCTNCTITIVTGVATLSDFYDKTKAPLTFWDFNNTWLENAADYPTFQP